MRLMLIASAAILFSLPAGAAAPVPARNTPVVNPNAEAPAKCPPTSRYEAARRGGPLAVRKLNELPAAEMYKAVYRRIDGCEVPIIAGYGIGQR